MLNKLILIIFLSMTILLGADIKSILFGSQNKSAYYTGVTNDLDALNNEFRQVKLFKLLSKKIRTFKSADEILPYLDWLQRQTLYPQTTSFRYSAFYGLYLRKVAQEETAKAVLLHSLLRLEQDIRRCKKSKDSITKYLDWKKVLQNNLKAIDIPYADIMNQIVFDVEDFQKNRLGDDWLCGDIDWVKAVSKIENIEEATIQRKNAIGRTIGVELTKDVALPVNYISEAKWQEKRQQIIKQFRDKYIQ